MKKNLFLIAAIAIAFISTSCMASKTAASTTTSEPQTTGKIVSALTSSNGIAAGKSLVNLYKQYKADGNKLDFSNSSNLTNLLNLATNIQGLKNGQNNSDSSIATFVKGLISGSSNLVNTTNSDSVLSGLTKIANLDLDSIKETAASAAKSAATSAIMSKIGGSTSNSSTTNETTNAASTILSGLFSNLTK